MLIYLAEFSTPFLNISWLLNFLKFQSSIPLTVCGVILLVAFFFCRVILGPYILYHMVNYWKEEPRYLYHINVGIVIFFICLNFYWFKQLLNVIFGSKKEKKKPEKNVKHME
jgi:hypothetical protein